jgi:hypothetical protein
MLSGTVHLMCPKIYYWLDDTYAERRNETSNARRPSTQQMGSKKGREERAYAVIVVCSAFTPKILIPRFQDSNPSPHCLIKNQKHELIWVLIKIGIKCCSGYYIIVLFSTDECIYSSASPAMITSSISYMLAGATKGEGTITYQFSEPPEQAMGQNVRKFAITRIPYLPVSQGDTVVSLKSADHIRTAPSCLNTQLVPYVVLIFLNITYHCFPCQDSRCRAKSCPP